jgi:hypothetical protein
MVVGPAIGGTGAAGAAGDDTPAGDGAHCGA